MSTAPQTGSFALPVEPNANTYSLAALTAMVRHGQVRVPHFQRGLRWGTADAVALIDSVLRGFPIGSLLLWRRHGEAGRVSLGQVQIDAPERTDALFVVDGQQRVTTFLNVFDPEAGMSGPFALVYDIKGPEFRVRARRPVEQDSIPLPTLFDLNLLLRWTRENPQHEELIDQLNAATTRLREYHVPVYEVRSDDDQALRDIYDRMNNAGKRLTRAEAFWGLYAPQRQSGAPDGDFYEDLRATARDLSWGYIDDPTLLYVLLARRGADITRDIHLEFAPPQQRRADEEFPNETLEEAREGAREALVRAIKFLRDEVGVPHFSFLAYRYLLVVISRFFAHFPEPQPRNLVLLRRWYWRAALAGPSIAKGSATGAMRQFASMIRPRNESDSIQALLTGLDRAPSLPDVYSFRTNHASGQILLCALWSLNPRDPRTGVPFGIQALSTEIGEAATPRLALQAAIPPQPQLRKELTRSLANRLILPGRNSDELFFSIGDSSTLGDRRQVADLSHSHAVPEVSLDTPERWLEERNEQLAQIVRAFLESRTEYDFDDSKPLDDYDLDGPFVDSDDYEGEE